MSATRGLDNILAEIAEERARLESICKHCGIKVYRDYEGKLMHVYGVTGSVYGSRTCTSAVADHFDAPWTAELVARREALRGKVAAIPRRRF